MAALGVGEPSFGGGDGGVPARPPSESACAEPDQEEAAVLESQDDGVAGGVPVELVAVVGMAGVAGVKGAAEPGKDRPPAACAGVVAAKEDGAAAVSTVKSDAHAGGSARGGSDLTARSPPVDAATATGTAVVTHIHLLLLADGENDEGVGGGGGGGGGSGRGGDDVRTAGTGAD